MWRYRSPDGTWSSGYATEGEAKQAAVRKATGKTPTADQVEILFKSAARAGWAVVRRA